MNIKDFNEALYTSSNGVVVERRKSTIIPIVVLVAGFAMLAANWFISDSVEMNNLKSALILIGGFTAIIGAICASGSIFGGGMPYHNGDKCFLVRKQYSFERSRIDEVVKAVQQCDRTAVENIGESEIAGVTVLCYYSPNSNYCVMQAFVYEEFTYQSVTKLATKA